jgi:hypothetical protein
VLLHRPAPPYQLHLGPVAHYPAGREPRAITVGDLDGDGTPDLVIADHADHAVHVLRADHAGGFHAPSRYATGKGAAAVALVDFNRDGKLDLAVADSLDNTVSVLMGKGNGSFLNSAAWVVGKKPVSVVSGDVNGDGWPDLVTANEGDGTVSVLLGDGGTFQKTRRLSVGAHPRALALADFNRDRKLDLAVVHYAQVGKLSVYLGKGDGAFSAPRVYPVGAYPLAVAGADFNGDGISDLAVANYVSSDINVLLGKGDGSFGTAVNYPTGTEGRLLALVAADINGDGRVDLVATTGFTANALCVLEGKGDGSFRTPKHYYGIGLGATGLAVFGNGVRPGIVTANARAGSISVLLNRPAAPFLGAALTLDTIDEEGMTCILSVRRDAAGGPLAKNSTLLFQSSDPQAVLPGANTFGAAERGPLVFRVPFRTRGSQTISVTDAAGAHLGASASTWVFGKADLRFLINAPGHVGAGRPFGITLNVHDPFGNWTNGYGGTVRFACTDPAATLPADYTFTRAEQLHTFTGAFTLPTPGRWTITATDSRLPALAASVALTVWPVPAAARMPN